MNLLNKIFRVFVLFIFFVYNISSSLVYVFSATSLDVTTIKINGTGVMNSTYLLNPGDKFGLDIYGQNNSGVDAKNVFANFSFSDNSKFSYDGINLKGVVNYANTITPIPSSAYNSTTGFSYQITNATSPLVASSKTMFVSRTSSLTFSGITVSPNISTYSNTLTAHFNGQSNIDSTNINGGNAVATILVNVKPHIIDYSFSKSSIVGNGVDSTDLIVKVKDFNGCSNISAGTVIANLSSIGLSSSTPLTYDSCDVDGKTATFKKVGITTTASVGTYNFSGFTATDSDGNQNNPSDTNFSSGDKTTTLSLYVATPSAPNVSISSLSPTSISNNPGYTSSTLYFSADQAGSYKVVSNGDGICSAGTIISDWTSYSTGVSQSVNINASSLSSASNTLNVCVKSNVGDIGSSSTGILLDTTAPTISSILISPASVTTGNSVVSFKCSETGTYKISINGSDISGYQPETRDTQASYTVSNSYLNVGANSLGIYCKDSAGNEVVNSSFSINKVQPTPAMTSSGMSLVDNDTSWDGVDGRDLKVTWDNSVALSYAGFESYRIYILPENTAFTGTYIGLVANSGATSWTGTSNITKDSLGNPLAGGNYVAYVAIMGTSGDLGTPASATGTMIADIVPHPSVLNASFTSTGNLRVKFDSPLKTDLSWSYATGFTFTSAGTSYTGISVSSVTNDIIDISIPNLPSTRSTGFLSVSTGAVTGLVLDGAYNYATGGIFISDNIAPSISFSTGTTSAYNSFYSGSLTLNYTTSETLSSSGNVKIDFLNVGGNNSTTKTVYISNTSELTAGSHSKTIDLVTLGLVSGAYYDLKFTTIDLNGNISQSTISSIKFDNTAPVVVSINPFGPNKVFGAPTPLSFTWLSTTDDSGNGSGVKGYKLRVFQGTQTYGDWKTCTGTYSDYDPDGSLINLSKAITMANLYNYAWRVYAYDNMGNRSGLSSCDNFYTNTNVPYLGSASVKDTVLNSTSYTKGGNNLQVSSTITNSDSAHIWLDASSIKDSSYSNINCLSPVSGVTCTYSSNIATYTFSAGALASLSSGSKGFTFTAANIAGVNTGTTIASITLDNTNPSPATFTLSNSIYGGSNMPVSFSQASDNIGIDHINLKYSSDGGTSWNNIGDTSNLSPYNWDISSIPSGTNYKLRITAYDLVGNYVSTDSSVFSIDKVAPTLTNPLISPISGKIRGGVNTNIIWNSGNISDSGGLKTNPINLYYTVDGTNFNLIASNLANNGSYTWAVPSSTNTTNAKIKIEAIDNVSNTGTFIGSAFEIDSTAPSMTVTYAGNGGATPLSNKYINNSGIDLTASISDTNLAGGTVSYSLYNQSNNTYWNGSVWASSSEVFNSIVSATGATYALNSTINPTGIISNNTYKLKINATDSVGNSYSNPLITYFGDVDAPNLAISNASGSYLSGSVLISGTSLDALSQVSSVKLEIKKGSLYWDGTSWVIGQQELNVSTSNNYANWNYTFNMPLSDNDGDVYTVTAISYDRAYKTNNSSQASISLIKDTSGPSVARNVFTIDTTGIKKGGTAYNITWDTSKISATGASLDNNSVELEYLSGASWYTIATGLSNSGSYSWTLPMIDQYTKVGIKVKDSIGNESNAGSFVLSNQFLVDSLPPSISSVETSDTDANGQIDALIVTFSEDVNGVTGSGFTVVGSNITSVVSTLDPKVYEFHFSNTGTTASTPNLQYAGTYVKDIAGNDLAVVTKSSVDKAAPRIEQVLVYDDNSNGKLDRIRLVASENIASTTTLNGFTLENPQVGMSLGALSVSGNNIDISLVESTNPDTSTGSMALSLNNSIYADLNGNLAGNLNSFAIADKAPPVLLSSSTIDSDANYKMDKFELTYSESLTGVSLGDFTISNMSTGASVGSMSINGSKLDFLVSETSADNDTRVRPRLNYSLSTLKDVSGNTGSTLTNYDVSDGIAPKIIDRYTIDSNRNGKVDKVAINFSEALAGSVSALNTTLDTYTANSYAFSGTYTVLVSLGEKPIYDTNATPTIRVLGNTSLTDTAGNLALTEASPSLVRDGVGPIVQAARYEASTHRIYVTYSENINPSDFKASNFVLANAGSYSITGTGNDLAGDYIVLSGETINYSSSTISFATNSVRDTLGNKQTGTNYISLSAPIIINEVMKSSNSNNDYIELKNLSTSVVDISGWTIAGVTIPASTTISASGYYLISKTSDTTSIINVVPDLVSSSLNLSTSTINLNNGSINLDTADLTNGLNDISTPASMERKSSIGNGLLASSWYTAVASVGFDNTTPKGTPKSDNIIDATAPNITSQLNNLTLLPTGNYNIVFDYTDNIAINTGSLSFKLEKWNGTSYDIVNSNYTTGTISNGQSNFALSNMSYGKYKVTFSISDTSNNVANIVRDFYIDKLEFDISTGSVNIGKLDSTQDVFATTTMNVTVKTLGAGLDLRLIGSGSIDSGLNNIARYNGLKGFGFDYAESGVGTKVYSGLITAINNTSLASYNTGSIDVDGNQKTYTYQIKYGARIDSMQVAGNYLGNVGVELLLNY